MAGRARAAQRKQENLDNLDQSWKKWTTCQLCGRRFCINNYEDRRSRVRRYQGLICCAFCQHNALPIVRNLLELKVLKLRKKK